MGKERRNGEGKRVYITTKAGRKDKNEERNDIKEICLLILHKVLTKVIQFDYAITDMLMAIPNLIRNSCHSSRWD